MCRQAGLLVQGTPDSHATAIQDVGVDHGGLHVLVAEQLLDSADVVAAFEEMGGKAVAEGMRGDRLVHLCPTGCLFDSFLQAGLAQVMALPDPADRIERDVGCGKDILPGKLTGGIGIFPFKGIGEIDGAQSPDQILVMQGSDLLEVESQGLEQGVGEHGEAVIFSLAISHDDLVIVKIQILNTQAQDFHEAEAAAVHKLGHELMDPVHLRDHPLGLVTGQDGGHPLGPARPDGKEGCLVQLHLENIPVEKENGADGLVLGGGGNCPAVHEIGDKVIDLRHAHLAGMALVMIHNVLAHPGNIGFLGAQGIMAVAQGFAVAVEQFFGRRRGGRCEALWHGKFVMIHSCI